MLGQRKFMINKVKDATDLKLFEIFGIELSDDKFIKKATGEEFVPIDIDESIIEGEYTYKCGDTIIKIECYREGIEDIPCEVDIEEDGIRYYIHNEHGKSVADFETVLAICEIESFYTEPKNITIKPRLNWKFIETEIRCPGSTKIVCKLDNEMEYNWCRQYSWGNYYGGELSLENYQKLLENIIKDVYEYDSPKICEAYLKCIPLLWKRVEDYIDFPNRYPKEFKEYLNDLVIKINEEAASKIKPIETAISEIESKAAVKSKKKD